MLSTQRLLGLDAVEAIAAMMNDINPGNPTADPPIPALNLRGPDLTVGLPQAAGGTHTLVQVTVRDPVSFMDYLPYTGTVTFSYNRLPITTFAQLAFANYTLSLPATTQNLLDRLALLFGFPFDPSDFVMEAIVDAGHYILKAQPTSLRWVGQYTVTVVDGSGIFIFGSLAPAIIGHAYTGDAFTVNGGVGPYHWSVDNLPAGLTMDSTTSVISGTTTTLGLFDLTIHVLDSQGRAQQLGAQLLVETPAQASGNDNLELLETFPSATVGHAYQHDLHITGGGGGYTYVGLTQGTLPPGLTITLVTHGGHWFLRMAGTPTAAYFGLIEPAFTSVDGQQEQQLMQMVVLTPVAVVGSFRVAELDVPYVDMLSITGGSGDYFAAFPFTTDDLPPGFTVLDVRENKLWLEGIPSTHGTFHFTVTILTGYGQSLTQQFSVTVP